MQLNLNYKEGILNGDFKYKDSLVSRTMINERTGAFGPPSKPEIQNLSTSFKAIKLDKDYQISEMINKYKYSHSEDKKFINISVDLDTSGFVNGKWVTVEQDGNQSIDEYKNGFVVSTLNRNTQSGESELSKNENFVSEDSLFGVYKKTKLGKQFKTFLEEQENSNSSGIVYIYHKGPEKDFWEILKSPYLLLGPSSGIYGDNTFGSPDYLMYDNIYMFLVRQINDK
jgi:hypothetical protein